MGEPSPSYPGQRPIPRVVDHSDPGGDPDPALQGKSAERQLNYFFPRCLAKKSSIILSRSAPRNPWPPPLTTWKVDSTPAFPSAACSSSLWPIGTSSSLSPCMIRNGGSSLLT